MNVIATIDVSSPTGRKIVRELAKHKKVVKLENPLPTGIDGLPEETFSLDESFNKLYDKLENHYGVDLRKL